MLGGDGDASARRRRGTRPPARRTHRRPCSITTSQSQTCSTSLRRCEDTSTVRSADERSPISWRISRMPIGSRPFVGSSRTSSSGSPRRAPAIPSRCFMPIEYSPEAVAGPFGETDLLEHGGDPGRDHARPSRPAPGGSRCRSAPGTSPVPRSARRRAGRKAAGESSGLAEHGAVARTSARTSPSSIAIVVVLPAPLGPMNPATTPRGSSKREVVDGRPIAVALGQPVDRHGRGGASCCHGSSIRRSTVPVVALVWRSGRRRAGVPNDDSVGQHALARSYEAGRGHVVWTRPFW